MTALIFKIIVAVLATIGMAVFARHRQLPALSGIAYGLTATYPNAMQAGPWTRSHDIAYHVIVLLTLCIFGVIWTLHDRRHEPEDVTGVIETRALQIVIANNVILLAVAIIAMISP